eukprot:TRINITY_DN1837_c0_g1_i2.p1 TRINITY_DN1837_c0_g1~~TRINITY_DN1837_c0_g1_i2.p1  ORF type:complete len:240 (+),score=35.94 TRINITY_DN1837_c0_g1_i2:136-855(+)
MGLIPYNFVAIISEEEASKLENESSLESLIPSEGAKQLLESREGTKQLSSEAYTRRLKTFTVLFAKTRDIQNFALNSATRVDQSPENYSLKSKSKSGWLNKYSKGAFQLQGKWVLRWVVYDLVEGSLVFYKNVKDIGSRPPASVIYLHNVKVDENVSVKKKDKTTKDCSFRVTTSSGVVYLSASTPQDKEDWMSAIEFSLAICDTKALSQVISLPYNFSHNPNPFPNIDKKNLDAFLKK